MQALPATIKKVWYIMEVIGAIVILAVYFAGNWAVQHFLKFYLPLWAIWGLFLVIVLWFLLGLLLVRYRYAFYHFMVNETDVEIQKGFFFRTHTAIPIARVQNVDLDQGPILRLFKLQQVHILTGGSGHEIEALTEDDAEQFKDKVMTLAREARHEG
ncbi:PH domain-containing protein [Fructobacillus americanaquae]|uniref:PH domain-containing protein n=1 Tax=Fructobacillus americanaquae TaxID=2940302 RepID=A0ABY5C0U6_9LACO|nr:PH domain-containing protein [Fructobacillus americanaquae]USS92217.1 PH domain-containing protein [Fructobacillus americanaquae]